MTIQETPFTWQKLHKNNPALSFSELTQIIVDKFILQVYDPNLPHDLNFIDQLCDMACKKADCERVATSAIFRGIVEELCDDFSIIGANTCLEVLVRILEFIRKNPEGAALDRLLTKTGYEDTFQLVKRFKRIQKHSNISPARYQKIKKIIILSRVTAGADIAITGVIINRLSSSFPRAELILIGPNHLKDMFCQVSKIRVVDFLYKNDGTLFEKMTNWPELLDIVQNEHQNLTKGEVLLFDTDTRLSQLGLLPLLAEEYSFYFPSRSIGFEDKSPQNLSTLTNRWLDTLLQEKYHPSPLQMFGDPLDTYGNLAKKLSLNGCQRMITINLGVGNDPRKKIPSPFEVDLLKCILDIPNTVVVLDTGRGIDEQKNTIHHLQTFTKLGFNTKEINETSLLLDEINFGHGLISYRGSLCNLGRLIKASDCFIGYDSCGQHIAYAANTPAVIVFAGAPSTRFIARWTPSNPASQTISILRDKIIDKRELDILLKKVLVAVRQVLGIEQRSC